jgi:hypothetical protein
VNYGAVVDIYDKWGHTPYDEAVKGGAEGDVLKFTSQGI